VDTKTAGLLLIAVAAVLAVIGLALVAGLLSWFGRLPGDVRIESDNVHVYVPFASMILVSVVPSVALAVINRLR
jgi:hypothetical protein